MLMSFALGSTSTTTSNIGLIRIRREATCIRR